MGQSRSLKSTWDKVIDGQVSPENTRHPAAPVQSKPAPPSSQPSCFRDGQLLITRIRKTFSQQRSSSTISTAGFSKVPGSAGWCRTPGPAAIGVPHIAHPISLLGVDRHKPRLAQLQKRHEPRPASGSQSTPFSNERCNAKVQKYHISQEALKLKPNVS